MEQPERDKIFLYRLKQIIADYAGRLNFADVIILENKDVFNYTEYKAAENNETAVRIYQTKNYRKKDESGWLDYRRTDHEALIMEFPDKVETITQDINSSYRIRKRLNLHVRKYAKKS